MAIAFSRRWATFAALSLLFFLVSAGTFSSLGVVLPAMVKELNQAGLGYTFLGVACGLSSLAAAAFVRRLGVRATLATGAAMLVAGFGALAVTHYVWVYLGATLIIGVAFSLVTVPGTHVLTGLFEKRSTILGAYFTLGALGGVAGPLLYVAIAPAAGWRAYWWVFSLSALVLGIFGAATTTGRPRASSEETAAASERLGAGDLIDGLHEWTVRRALATPQFYVIVGAYTMYLLINTTAHGFAVEHLTERGISPKAAAEMLSLEALIGAGVAVIGGWAGERVKPRILMIAALASLIVGMSALAEARGYPLMLVYAVGVGIGFGLSFVASTMLLLTFFGRRAYLELYSIMCLLSTIAALGPAVGGWTRDVFGSFAGVFHLCSAAAFVMLVATVLMRVPRMATGRKPEHGEVVAAATDHF
jgi:MFS family permease